MTHLPQAILSDLSSAFGIIPKTVTAVPGGYLNEKWRVDTDDASYLLKRFSPARYAPAKLDSIEQALKRQEFLYEQGVSCPRVFDCDGTVLRRLSTEQGESFAYMLMSFEDGITAAPDTVTAAQMQSLGEQCARMHNALRTFDVKDDAHYPLHSTDAVRRLTDHRARLTAFPDYHLPPGTDAILSTFNEAFFDAQAKQLCHEDFSADNLLFAGDRAVILDFDRGQYSYPMHDVGRALLSLAYDGTELRIPLVRAFADGYRRHGTLTDRDIISALRLTLACEFSWWMHPDCETSASPKVLRFIAEMHFLIHNWDAIPSITEGV
ncbi:MAG: phosphotransferase [Clostridia bacterium]|nr:phosphotransferase [Clostridia bacterium]